MSIFVDMLAKHVVQIERKNGESKGEENVRDKLGERKANVINKFKRSTSWKCKFLVFSLDSATRRAVTCKVLSVGIRKLCQLNFLHQAKIKKYCSALILTR